MTAEQNIAFMHDPRCIEAREAVDKVVHRIQCSIKVDGNAGYYLTVLPVYLQMLEEANDNLIVTEATVEAEVLEKIH